MKGRNGTFYILLVTAAIIGIGGTAAAKTKAPAAEQKMSPLASELLVCDGYLQLSHLEFRVIFAELERLAKLRAERGAVIRQTSPAPNSAGVTGQGNSSATTASPELLKIYDVQIEKIEAEFLPKRRVLEATNAMFRKCINDLPRHADAAKDTESRKTKR